MKTIFIDLDETLLNNKKEVSMRTIKAIKQATKDGHQIVACTGAPYDLQLKRLEKLYSGDNALQYFISGNGSFIYDVKNSKEIYISTINPEVVEMIYDMAMPYCDDFCFHMGTGSGRLSKMRMTFSDIIKEYNINQVEPYNSNKYDVDRMKMLKGMIENFASNNGLRIANYTKVLDDEKFAHEVKHLGFDIVNADISKGSGVTRFCEHFGIDKADTIAIGDGFNDVAMFKVTGYSVAMGNALDNVKKMANHVTDTNDNDGVAKFLEEKLPALVQTDDEKQSKNKFSWKFWK